MRIEFEFDSDWMLSTNDMYIHKPKKTKNGKWTCYTTKSNALRDFQVMMGEILNNLILDETVKMLESELLDNKHGLDIETVYYMPLSNYESSDASNYIKSYEDCISTRFKGSNTRRNHVLDDKNNLSYSSIKKFIGEGIDHWHVKTTIIVSDKDKNYIDYINRKEGM